MESLDFHNAASGNLENIEKNACPWNFTTFRAAAGQCVAWDVKTFKESCVHPSTVKWITHHSMTTFK